MLRRLQTDGSQQTNGRGALDQIKPKTNRKRNIIAFTLAGSAVASVVSYFPPSLQRLLVVVTGSYLSCCCLLRVSGQCWPLTSSTHFLHTTATLSGHCKQGWPGLPSGSFKNKTRLSYVAGESWDNYVGKNHTRLMQMTQSACRMNVDSGGVGWRGGGGCEALFDRDSERNQATNSTVITGTAPVGERGHAGNWVLCLRAHYSGFV